MSLPRLIPSAMPLLGPFSFLCHQKWESYLKVTFQNSHSRPMVPIEPDAGYHPRHDRHPNSHRRCPCSCSAGCTTKSCRARRCRSFGRSFAIVGEGAMTLQHAARSPQVARGDPQGTKTRRKRTGRDRPIARRPLASLWTERTRTSSFAQERTVSDRGSSFLILHFFSYFFFVAFVS